MRLPEVHLPNLQSLNIMIRISLCDLTERKKRRRKEETKEGRKERKGGMEKRGGKKEKKKSSRENLCVLNHSFLLGCLVLTLTLQLNRKNLLRQASVII